MDITAELFNETKKYLIGPQSENEVLPEHPEEFYISGLLFPKQSHPNPEDYETLDAGGNGDSGGNDDSGMVDDSRHSSSRMLPNSLGLRCNLTPKTSKIKSEVSFARYILEESGWRRVHIKKKILLHIEDKNEEEILDEDGGLLARLSWKVDKDRNNNPPSFKMFSIFLSNEQDEPDKEDVDGKTAGYIERKNARNQRILFQPEIKLDAENENTFLGTEVSQYKEVLSNEEHSLDMLYRKKTVYGQGYNCAADWGDDKNSPSFVKTELLPQYQSKQILFNSTTDENRLDLIDMTDIEEAQSQDDVYSLLEDIPKIYSKWIQNLPNFCKDLEPGSSYHNVAKEHQEKCQEALDRIKAGLELIKNPANRDDIFEAFKIANRAMLYQRVHYKHSIDKAKGGGKSPKNPRY